MRHFSVLRHQRSLFRRPATWILCRRQCSCSAPSKKGYRALGTSQDLFVSSVYSPGSPLFLPNGTHIVNKLIAFLRTQYLRYGFREVLTPTIYKRSLWEVSGHWQNYKDDMYEARGRGANRDEEGEDEVYGLKPMNCPGHCLLFKSQTHSYRELPIRYADFSPLHRNEVSGALSGLTRVRRFHQDDGHIFCRPQQIGHEIALALQFVEVAMTTFGLGPYRLVLSTRPESGFIGAMDQWDSCEAQLRDALNSTGRSWEVNEGDGAFYGPKIDIQLQDESGKHHQLSTIQLDMNLPQRFGLEYQVAEGEEDYKSSTPGRATPVLIHRAIFGSLERCLALLIEQYAGHWPFWLSPRQAIILTVNQEEKVLQRAREAADKLAGFHAAKLDKPLSSVGATFFLVDVDSTSQTLSKKIQRAKQMKYNLIFVLGPKDVADGSITVDVTGQMRSRTDEGSEKLQRVMEPRLGVRCLENPRLVRMKEDEAHELMEEMEKQFL